MEQRTMAEALPVEFREDRVPAEGIAEAVGDLVDLFGGEITGSADGQRRFVLPLRRGVAVAGGVECTLSWAVGDGQQAAVTLVCDRDVDAPRGQRIALLVAGVIGALLFTFWPFFGKEPNQMGTLALAGGILAIAVYLLTLRRAPGGIAHDFLQRLARRQRETAATP